MHKFTVGQLAQFDPDRKDQGSAARGPYEVTRQLPHNGRENENWTKSQTEDKKRIARESQLSSA